LNPITAALVILGYSVRTAILRQFFFGATGIVPIQIIAVAFLGGMGRAAGNAYAVAADFSARAGAAKEHLAAAIAPRTALVITQRGAGFGNTICNAIPVPASLA
jgi:hypothetical protein